MTLSPRLRRVIQWVCIPLGYLTLFFIFCYCTFPYDRLKERLILEYEATQKDKPAPNVLRIGDISWSWRFPGVVLNDVQLVRPASAHKIEPSLLPKPQPTQNPPPEGSAKVATSEASDPPPEPGVTITEAHVRIAPLTYLFGTTEITFGVQGMGGELSGSYAASASAKRLEAEFSNIDPGQIPGVVEVLQLPLAGRASGAVQLNLPEGKLSLAEGKLDITIEDLGLGDGVTKIRGLLALPQVHAGTLHIGASAAQGHLTLERLEVKGQDLEAVAEGKLRLRDRLELSLVEQLTLSFKFSDKYRDRDDTTRALFGKPGDKLGGAFDLDSKIKRAKQPDGTYYWRIMGSFGGLTFLPARPTSAGSAGKSQPP